MLSEMGLPNSTRFTVGACHRALKETDGSEMDVAVSWLLDCPEDEEVPGASDEPPPLEDPMLEDAAQQSGGAESDLDSPRGDADEWFFMPDEEALLQAAPPVHSPVPVATPARPTTG